MVESVVGCKWSVHVLLQIRAGINRPGVLVRSMPGLTTKVLNERLVKLQKLGILTRQSWPEIPPRVEYCLTPFGARFMVIVDAVSALQRELDEGRAEPAVH